MKKYVFCFLILLISFLTCKKDDPVSYLSDHRYPNEIRNIILPKCATSGCHNTASAPGADGLDLSSWAKMFEGGKNGSSVIPYSPDLSFLCYFINTYPEYGPDLLPKMPLNKDPLSKAEVKTIYEWIRNGAPDAGGFVMFSDNPSRKKFYVSNQGCDLVGVYDAASKLLMRYVKVGVDPNRIESPHMIKVSPDGKYWYVVFTPGGTVLQRYNTSDDTPAGQVTLGTGDWNTVSISSDSKRAYCVSFQQVGTVAVVDLENMTLLDTLKGFAWPHGSSLGVKDDTLYVTAQFGNFLYKIPVNDFTNYETVVLGPNVNAAANTLASIDPHELVFSPDRKKYFVACEKSNEVVIMQSSPDKLLARISVGDFPQEPVVSSSTDYLFVTCKEDSTKVTQGRGSVAIINYKTDQLVKIIYTGYQPHGIAVDDENKLVYVANSNFNPTGPAPHHTSTCAGRNGYVTVIDMNTLELVPGYKSETSVFPYSVAVRK